MRQRILNALLLRAAAVEDLDARSRQQLLIEVPQRRAVQRGGGLLRAETGYAVALAAAHLLQQALVGVLALVVKRGADRVDQIILLALHVVRAEHAALPRRAEQHLAEQVGGGLEQLFAAGRELVVNEAGDEAEAVVFALLAHREAQPRAVQQVERAGQRAHVGMALRAAAQHGGQQRARRGAGRLHRRHELHGQQPRFELLRTDIVEVYAGRQLLANRDHGGSFLYLM